MVKQGLTSTKKYELRRKNRVLEIENEILKRASAYFAGRISSQDSVPNRQGADR